MTDNFDPGDPACWTARGRPTHHAQAIAEAWRCFPDLPHDAPLDARQARTRERVQMLRPLHDAISLETEQQRRAANFAYVERQIAQGSNDTRHAAILHARDVLSYDWDAAYAYADGHYAARAGWVSRPPSPSRPGQPNERRPAYEQGFLDGGGQPDDIFDVARRSFAAAPSEPMQTESPQVARPFPSQWPSPTDIPPPASWHRRLLLLGASELAAGTIGILAMLRGRPGHEGATLLAIDRQAGLLSLSLSTGPAAIDGVALRDQLHQSDYADILVVADDAELARIDAGADILPLARTMERTRNSVLQQRAQFRHWLSRGRAAGDQFAAGHIRWSKMAAGLSGRLGDFTARYAGPAKPRGHRIVVEDASGEPAFGYRTALGQELQPEILIGNKSNARSVMADLLREYAASLRLG
ncbi:hypothetical protein [Edaphosphingomonas haloaromaticamans]|uniref:Uncharacterized protein n=1 Tax=Edaphosphingomonas haloaromaticamans TaxID=653954 RepID=A0A1S1HMA0_9SPHN|nr:hypothetical protein [Sphingomonas haloaromaticamans]OHT21620.1 hypothetical protein BHE75_03631 [Sphingomonas haloaromaticamans]